MNKYIKPISAEANGGYDDNYYPDDYYPAYNPIKYDLTFSLGFWCAIVALILGLANCGIYISISKDAPTHMITH